MDKVQSHLTDHKKVQAYNARKEQKLRAFASYLLIAWVSTNVLFVAMVSCSLLGFEDLTCCMPQCSHK